MARGYPFAMSPRTTLADVARVAGVSTTTASHALSGKGRVDEGTRAQVRRVADDLGYVPSRAARSLALGRSDTIGLLLPPLARMPLDELLSTDWYGRVVAAASHEALRHHRALAVLPPVRTASDLSAFALDGIIVLDPIVDDPRWPALQQCRARTVLLGKDPAGALGPSVVPDIPGGIESLLDHLSDRGARRIGVVATDIAWLAGDDTLAAYRAWCQERGARPVVAVAPVSACGSRAEVAAASHATALELLSSPDRPDALIGLLEDFGRGILSAARQLGLAVPDDLLVAQDIDGVVAQVNDPAITAIDLNINGQLAAAVELLVTESTVDADFVITVPVSLAIRASTGAIPR